MNQLDRNFFFNCASRVCCYVHLVTDGSIMFGTSTYNNANSNLMNAVTDHVISYTEKCCLVFKNEQKTLFFTTIMAKSVNQLKSYKSEMSVKEYWSLPSGCCRMDLRMRLVFGSMM